MDQKCIFCAIVGNQIPSLKVYEDSDFMAFLDIRPLNKGHALVVPKKHYKWTYDIEAFGSYWEVAKKVSLAIIGSLEPKFVQYFTFGLEVPHAHIHVVPRYEDDGHGVHIDPSAIKQIPEQEMKDIAVKIKNSIPVDIPKVEEKLPEPVKEEKKWSEEELESIRRELQET